MTKIYNENLKNTDFQRKYPEAAKLTPEKMMKFRTICYYLDFVWLSWLKMENDALRFLWVDAEKYRKEVDKMVEDLQ